MRGTLAILAALIALAAAGCGGGAGPHERSRFDAERAFADLRAQTEIGRRPSGSAGAAKEVALIVRRLHAAGLRKVAIQRPWRNIVATIPGSSSAGSSSGYVVLGAHYDTKDDVPSAFTGANDGASGVAILLELARQLPRRYRGSSIVLAFFDGEEARGKREFRADGTRGSRQFVRYAVRSEHGSPPVRAIRAMVLFDLVGDCDQLLPREENSDIPLFAAFADASADVNGEEAPFIGEAHGVLDDHVPFLLAGIPALDVVDFQFGPGAPPGKWLHSAHDTIENVCPDSLDAVGEAAIRALPSFAGTL